MTNSNFETTNKNRVKQVAKRGVYNRNSVYQILDASLVGCVAFIIDKSPFAIPMLFARQCDELLLHGSTKSRLMQQLISGNEICITVSITDGLVFAKSLFHHSMNYRSATVFGTGRELIKESEKNTALKAISDKVMPGRWEQARHPNQKELKATCVAAIRIDSGSAKIRTGGPVDDATDMKLPVWTGVVPLAETAQAPVPNRDDPVSTPIPANIKRWIDRFNSNIKDGVK